jgi:K319-like protein
MRRRFCIASIFMGSVFLTFAPGRGQDSTPPSAPTNLRVITNCQSSSTTWLNNAFSTQVGRFTAEFDTIPDSLASDSVVGLSRASGSQYGDFATLVRFNSSGTIDVRNGDFYAAAQTVNYTVGSVFHFRLVVDIPSHTYNVFLTPPSGAEMALASGYAFRTEQSSVTSLANWGAVATAGSQQVCNFSVTVSSASIVAVAGADQLLVDADGNGVQTVMLDGSGSSSSNGPIVSYTWSEGQTTLANGSSPTASVNLGLGSHLINLVVTDGAQQSATDSLSVTIQAAAAGVTPIARWDVTPRQRINAGEALKLGVVAFSKNGISKVRFSVSGKPDVDVTSMTLNDQSGVWEYWFSLAANDFSSDGQVTVNATAFGADGAARVLEALPFTVNPKGTLRQGQAWVAASGGSDSTGAVNNSSKPFATVGKAIDAIRAWMSANGLGNKADGGIVYMMPGTHTLSNGGIGAEIPTVNEWVVVTTATAGTKDTTIIQSGSNPPVKLLAYRGVTLKSTGAYSYLLGQLTSSLLSASSFWVDDCKCVGAGRWVDGSSIAAWDYDRGYFTDSYLSDCDFPTRGATSCRGLTIEHIGNDSFQNIPMIVNCTINDQDPGTTGWHSDVVGDTTGESGASRIVYGLKATNCHYQGFCENTSWTWSQKLQGMAWVNVYLELDSPIVSGGGGSGWYYAVDHLIMWHMSFVSKTATAYSHPLLFHSDYNELTSMTNVSVIGCRFDQLWQETSTLLSLDLSNFAHNHYCISSGGGPIVAPGVDKSTGNPMTDSSGRPLTGSPLIGRVSPPVVPCDIEGRPRGTSGDVGAFQH